ncbi:MAG TPA: hypothetical protein VFH70_05670 [Acidimicrobiales bacterium]|nr:hypothetical protein [Acidimicrobiales bacterium]
MIRFAWLQARTQTAVVVAGVAVVAVVAAVTGPHLGHLYATAVAGCRTQDNCVGPVNPFTNSVYNLYGVLGMMVVVLPGVVGLFWGAPLVARELESGTYRLAWTQSVGRRRWLAAKLGVVGMASVTAAGLLSLAVSWSARSIDLTKADQFRYFDQRDIVPIGYAAFAFALGVVIGLLVRRVLPALAATLVAFVACRYTVERWVRAHLVAASHTAVGLHDASGIGFTMQAGEPGVVTFQAEAPHMQNAYVLSAHLADKSGRPVSSAALHQFLVQHCPTIFQAPLVGATPAGAGTRDRPILPPSMPASTASRPSTTRASPTSLPPSTGRFSGWRRASTSARPCYWRRSQCG